MYFYISQHAIVHIFVPILFMIMP